MSDTERGSFTIFVMSLRSVDVPEPNKSSCWLPSVSCLFRSGLFDLVWFEVVEVELVLSRGLGFGACTLPVSSAVNGCSLSLLSLLYLQFLFVLLIRHYVDLFLKHPFLSKRRKIRFVVKQQRSLIIAVFESKQMCKC